jgi:hypothetical protein
MKIKNLTVILILFFLCSCKTKNKVLESSSKENSLKAIDLLIDKNYQEKKQDKSFGVNYAEIQDNQLILEINYSGGCAEHGFQLTSNGMWAKSYPPQMFLYINHNSNDDKCRELVSKKLYFNIESAQYSGTNLVILKIENYKNQIEYKY